MSSLTALIRQLQQLVTTLSDAQLQQIETLLAEGAQHHAANWGSHMTPAASNHAVLGQLLAASHNGNLLSPHLYPALAAIESELLTWFCRQFHQPHAHFIHSGSYANLEALWQAREAQGSASRTVYASEAAHYSIAKACRILGLQYQTIATDNNGMICISQLQQACSQTPPLAVVATAGTPASGAIDPLDECIDIAHHYQAWCHIDATWGGVLKLLDPSIFTRPFSRADSLCFDPHKALEQVKPCSILFYQQERDTFDAVETDYLHTPPRWSLNGSYGGELFLPLWCSLFNKTSLFSHIRQRLSQAARFAKQLQSHSRWKVWHSPTGIVCFRPDIALDLSELERQGILSQATLGTHTVYRVVFASHYTQADALITALSPYF